MKCDERFNSFPRKMLYKFTDPLNLVHELQIKGPDLFKSLHFRAPDLTVNIQYTITVVVVQGGKKRKRKSWDLKKGEMVDPRPHRQWVTELETNPRLSGQCSLYPITLKQGLLEFLSAFLDFYLHPIKTQVVPASCMDRCETRGQSGSWEAPMFHLSPGPSFSSTVHVTPLSSHPHTPLHPPEIPTNTKGRWLLAKRSRWHQLHDSGLAKPTSGCTMIL